MRGDLKIREVESLHEVVDAYPVDKLLTAGDPAYLRRITRRCSAL